MFTFEWDEAKKASNVAKHGITFERAVGVFDLQVVTWSDDREDYDEPRHITVGSADGVMLTVVHTARAGRIRIISARLASRRERRDYAESLRQATDDR